MNPQSWNSSVYEKNARFVTTLGAPVVELLTPKAGERILDIGCGDGVLTRKLGEFGCEVVGVDSSPDFIASAQALGVDAKLMSAYDIDYSGEFDAVFSNAALHWMKDPDKIIGKVYRALRPGGRFVAECGGQGCVETIHGALIKELYRRGYDGQAASPWYFASVDDYQGRLEAAGFDVTTIQLIPRPTPLPGDVMGWLETFSDNFTSVLPQADRRQFLEDVREAIRPTLCDAAGNWTADYVRLRFEAFRRS